MLLIPLNMTRAEADDRAGNPHPGWRGFAENFLDFICTDDDGVVGVDVPLHEVAVTSLRAELADNRLPEKCAFAFLELIVVPAKPLTESVLIGVSGGFTRVLPDGWNVPCRSVSGSSGVRQR